MTRQCAPRPCCFLLMLALAVAPAATAWCQKYPERPVRVIVPFPPASGVDVVARILAPELSERLGQNIVMDNRAGAAGSIGTELAARSPADGYTLFMITASQAFTVNLHKKLPYDIVRDFTPIALVAVSPNMLVVGASVPASTVKEFVALAKVRPRSIRFASSGVGSASHLAGALFELVAGVQLAHVAYKGAGPAMIGLLGGEVQAAFFSIPSSLPQLKTGRLRALGIGSPHRSDLLPDVPAIAEAGVPGYDAATWYGLVAPAGTPRSIVEKVGRETAQSLKVPAVQDRLHSQGAEPRPGTPQDFAAFIKAEIAKYARVAKAIGPQIE